MTTQSRRHWTAEEKPQIIQEARQTDAQAVETQKAYWTGVC